MKSKLSTAKKSKILTFSRVFHPKKLTIFSRNQSWIFGQQMKISIIVTWYTSYALKSLLVSLWFWIFFKKGPLKGPVAVGCTFSRALQLCFEREKPDKRGREVSSLLSASQLRYSSIESNRTRVTPPLSPERTSNSVVGKQSSILQWHVSNTYMGFFGGY